MGLNFIGGGMSKGLARGILYGEVREKLVTGFVPSIKAYGKTIVDETLINKYGKLGAVTKSYLENLTYNFLYENFLLR